MKKVILSFLTISFICLSVIGNAQTTAVKSASSEEPTPQNVLKWTKEVLPKMEQLAGKLEKIKPVRTKDIESQKNYLKALQTLRNINTKGTNLTAAEARRHDTWFKGVFQTFYMECQSHNGNTCCVSCSNHGFLGIWCFANCFVANFPDNNN